MRRPLPPRATALLALLVCLIATGCGGNSGGSGGAPGAPRTVDPNGVLRVGLAFPQPARFDPLDETGVAEPGSQWLALIYGQMLGEAPDGTARPALATEWKTPDDTTVELTLRPDAKFSDGTTLDATAVKYSWDRCKADAGFKLDLWNAYDSATVTDPTHLVVSLNKPYAGVWVDWLLKQPYYCMPVVSPTAVQQKGAAFSEAPVGAGPYMLDSYQPGQKVTLVRNPHYFAPDEQSISRIEFVQTAPGPSTVTALAAGQIDMAAATTSTYPAFENQGIAVAKQNTSTVIHLNLCTTAAPLTTPDARAALLHAIDVDEIVSTVYRGEATKTRQVLPEHDQYYSPVGADQNGFDLELARQLAHTSGLAGQSIDLMTYAIAPEFNTATELIKAQLAKIDVTVNIIPSQNILADKLARKPSMDIWGWYPQSVSTTLTPGGINNTCGTDIPELTAAFSDIYRADREVARQAWTRVQEIVNEQVPALPMFVTNRGFAHTDRVVGDFVMPINGVWGLDYSRIGIAAD